MNSNSTNIAHILKSCSIVTHMDCLSLQLPDTENNYCKHFDDFWLNLETASYTRGASIIILLHDCNIFHTNTTADLRRAEESVEAGIRTK